MKQKWIARLLNAVNLIWNTYIKSFFYMCETKLKYTTKLFIVVNLIAVLFRTVQICALTESGTAFLKDGTLAINIVGTLISIVAYILLFYIAFKAVRQPEKVNCEGVPSIVALGVTGSMYLIGCVLSVVIRPHGWGMTAITSLVCVVAILSFMDSAYKKKALSKVWFLAFIAYWLVEFVEAYLFYTERPLRVRTVYETAALCFVVGFLIVFGKAISGVKSEENFRLIYPLGLTACSLCIMSFVPETIATIIGFGQKVSVSAVMPEALVAAAVFTGFFTINTFKKSNTIHPKMKQRFEMDNAENSIVSKTVDSDDADKTADVVE